MSEKGKIHWTEDGRHYYCNLAVSAKDDKMTTDIRKVTCKNCLKGL